MNHEGLAQIYAPPAWSVQLGTAGQVVVFAIAFLCLLGVVLGFANQVKWSARAFAVGALGFFVALGILSVLMMNHRFEYAYVYKHSSLSLEPRYLFAAIWGGQEGSFLLWACTSAFFGLLVLRKVGPLQRWFVVIYAGFLGSLAAILSYESPFARIPAIDGQWLVPPDGAGLNASLMNYWMVIHPPTIFMGFGSLTVLFAFAWAAMIGGDVNDWVQRARPWALVSVSLLGLGLCMGGFWAYETLGWGGFWEWDPVETTSFVPWCAAVAFVHGVIVQQSRKRSQLTNLWLGAAPFLLFCYGTFMTRSGFLGDTSVHSFAEMNKTALWILVGVVAIATLGFLGTYVARLAALRKLLPEAVPSPGLLNKEKFYNSGIWLTSSIALFSAIGMSVPLFQSIAGHKPKVVEETLYHQVLVWPFLPLMLAMAIAPVLSWKSIGWGELWRRIANPLPVAIGATGFLLIWLKSSEGGLAYDANSKTVWFGSIQVATWWWIAVLAFFCFFVMTCSLSRLIRYSPKDWPGRAGLIAHVGLALMIFGLIGSRAYEKKTEVLLNSAYPSDVFGEQVTAVGRTGSLVDPNNKIKLNIERDGHSRMVEPTLYYMNGTDGQPTPMAWPAIEPFGLSDYYYVVHELTFEATDPMLLKTNQVGEFKGVGIQYDGLRTEGTLGTVGAGFMADITALTDQGTIKVAPKIKISGPGQIDHIDAHLTDQLDLHLVSIDAADKSANVQILFRNPAYPATIFYKPLVRFVWIGVGIMTIGGLMAAFARRYRPRTSEAAREPESSGSAEDRSPLIPGHATASSTQV